MKVPVKKIRKYVADMGALMEDLAVPSPYPLGSPEELHLEITYRCDLKCIMCNLSAVKKKNNTGDLSLKEIKDLVESSKLLRNIKYLIISGGEPWLNPEFHDIVTYLRGRFPDASMLILSNLFNTTKIIEELERLKKTTGLKRMSIGTSLDGLRDTHDRIRGVPSAFDSLTITALAIRKKFPEVTPCFNFTLLPENADQILETYRWADNMNFYLSYQVMVQKKETRKFKWSRRNLEDLDRGINDTISYIWERMGWHNSGPGRLLEKLEILFTLLNFHYMYRFVKAPVRFFPDCPCGTKYAMIDPAGTLYFCPVHKDLTAGSIKDNSFDMLWNGAAAGKAREFFSGRSCSCWLSCTSGPMLERAFFPRKDDILRKIKEQTD